VTQLAAIWISNSPEALGASVNLGKEGITRQNIRLMWWGILAVSTLSAGIGHLIVSAGCLAAFGSPE
jgi:hypothetical protein